MADIEPRLNVPVYSGYLSLLLPGDEVRGVVAEV